MSLSDEMYQQNDDGTWSQAVPLPMQGLVRRICYCGKKFLTNDQYIKHYRKSHTNGIAYQRTPTGMVAIDRRFQ